MPYAADTVHRVRGTLGAVGGAGTALGGFGAF